MDKEYKVIYGTDAATQDQLDAIEEIVVEQEADRAWEARIKIAVCLRDDGTWDSEDDPSYDQHTRVRIEARIGEGEFVPLIDGKIVDHQTDFNALPGLSSMTLVVHDDTTELHRETGSETYSGTDSEIANRIFSDAALGGEIDVGDLAAGADQQATINRNGTRMQMLRELRSRHPSFHVYVTPGQSPGTSDMHFTEFPDQPDPAIPDMYLSGPDQNLSEFRVQRTSTGATRVEGAHLSTGDKTITSADVGPNDRPPATGEPASSDTPADTPTRRLPPGIGDVADIHEAAESTAAASAYTLSADGSVLPMCYPAVLSPYRMARVFVSNSRFSGNYVIFKVTHTLGVSEYTQSFSMRGNAVAAEDGPSASLPAPAAAISASFNVQVNIF